MRVIVGVTEMTVFYGIVGFSEKMGSLVVCFLENELLCSLVGN